jgi:hypothetical protein
MIHKNKYDYSLVKYVNRRTKIDIICPYHDVFKQTPLEHKNGSNCPLCSKENNNNLKRKDYEWLKKCENKFKNKYDHSNVHYITNQIKIKIICPIHGEFLQTPQEHFKYGCSICNLEKRIDEYKEKFIKNSKIKHNNKYDYSLIDYKNNKTKIKIICPIHGGFRTKTGFTSKTWLPWM